MRRRIVLFVLPVTAVLFFFGWRNWKASHEEAGLVLYGNVDIREVNLGFRVAGKVRHLLKDEGDRVQPGEVLARLDDEPFIRELEESAAQVSTAEARLTQIQRGYRPEEIAQARALLNEREATLANAERIRIRKQDLAGRNVVPTQELDDAIAVHSEAEARRNSAKAALALLEAGYRVEENMQAQGELARARAQHASAKLRLEDAVLKAVEGGTVMTRSVEAGAIVQAGTTVMSLSLIRPVWVRLYVHEPELGLIKPGQKVHIFTDSHPGTPYEGQIGFISSRAEFTPKNVETTELRTQLVYRLRVVIQEPDEGLRQGMPVTARIEKP